jgi:glycine/D-amino acid oxidase-like deaminating enzyme
MRHDAHGHWLREAGPVTAHPPLRGDARTDLAVIGGGYTGMWTAWFLSELAPGASVAILEADVCGHGPSGRNGGFANAMWFNLPGLCERFGDAAAGEVARASQRAVDGIGSWCEAEGVDAWFRRAGYLQVSTTPAHDRAWDPVVQACSRIGESGACVPVSPDDVAGRCRSPAFRGGALYPGAATVQPARLALGLRARLADRGVAVYEHTRVRGLAAGPAAVTLDTGAGRLRARAVVLAAGSALAGVPPLRRRLTVTSSHMVITEPVPDVLEEVGWTGGECVTDSRALVNYLRTTPDGRIAFGWGGGRVVPGARLHGRAEVDPAVIAGVRRNLLEFFPGLAGRRLEHAWGGPIDVSPTHLPIVGSIGRDRVHHAFGFTGNGVGPSRLAGEILASLALERRDERTRLALVQPDPARVPPEPLRFAGGSVVRNALMRRERAELADRRPGRLTAFVAGLPERLGVQIGR